VPKTKVPSLYTLLKDRRSKLQQNLKRLANADYAIVKYEATSTQDDLPRAVMSALVRVRQTNFRFRMWEDFREFSGAPTLYGFAYSLEPQDPGLGPLFRFECHPDVEDVPPEDDSTTEPEDLGQRKLNPYSVTPHFHPDNSRDHPISRLHYPFQRSERASVVFALIAWIEMDLVKRFYDTGRVVITN